MFKPPPSTLFFRPKIEDIKVFKTDKTMGQLMNDIQVPTSFFRSQFCDHKVFMMRSPASPSCGRRVEIRNLISNATASSADCTPKRYPQQSCESWKRFSTHKKTYAAIEAGATNPWHNVADLVQHRVDSTGVDRHLRVVFCQPL